MLKHFLDRKFFNFLVVGGLATAFQFLLLALMVELLSIPEVLASGLAYAVSAVSNYLLNYYLTFGQGAKHSQAFPKFLVVVVIGLTVNTVVFAACFALLSYYLLAQLIATSTTLIVNFLLHKFWIYRSPL